ncbi:MAG: GAF domain-containing protein, partial [Arenibacter sp.]
QPSFREIVFDEVYPLYGQVDIQNSSQERNMAIQRDLMIQLSEIKHIMTEVWQKYSLPIYEELIFRVDNHLDEIKEVLHTNSEQAIFDFVQEEINPVFAHIKKSDTHIQNLLLSYETKIDKGTGSYYDHRKNYDQSVMLINKKLASVIDSKQEEAQQMYPHYFERYKTDGVEHNMYIGDSITGARAFDLLYLNNLRLWQLQVICEMENKHYDLKSKLQVQLNVASLILVYNGSLSIRFRMDEKRFDVDGTYNARYEIIKKRIDKSYIKGTNERLTQAGKIAIVYSQKKDELEYLRYIRFLKSKGYFSGKVEIVELEGLQGVSGLKAIRASILYKSHKEKDKTYTYEDLMLELNK